MTQEEKELLLKDLCARLLYKPRVRYYYHSMGAVAINGYSDEGYLSYQNLEDFSIYPKYGLEETRVCNILPYLRPLSSMTDNEREDWYRQSKVDYDCEFKPEPTLSLEHCHLSIDWLNKYGFDYRGLIPMGLALEATEGMYNIKAE